ncbi:hypothetical protein PMI29_00695 [Pseudomonas sp. GM49]|uniref:hypothetical protein n=1 Tax=Pseudomonas sp. GM49 TaxID=1144331 RepID=UPI0002707183|nr:hypothetical protein [Pseudomonas sp. GM49]EJM73889.1 hypothetical protein PMI29_00695 [Pseudomonas sp. GM49]
MGHFPSWMLQSAHNYLKAAEVLDAQNLPHVAQVNAAIGMEILLKSFISVPDQHQGTSGETHKLDAVALAAAHQHLQSADKTRRKNPDRHDLLTLFHAMPEAIRRSLALDSQEDSFERYRDVFTNSRYPYESSSWKYSDPVLMRLLRWTLANVVGYYKEQGSQDPFVLDYIAEVQARAAGE